MKNSPNPGFTVYAGAALFAVLELAAQLSTHTITVRGSRSRPPAAPAAGAALQRWDQVRVGLG